MAGKKYPRVVMPAAVAAYAWLSKPDSGHQFSDDKFKVTMVYDSADVLSDVEAACVALAKEQWPNLKPADLKLPFVDGDDRGKEEFEGKTIVTLKSKYKPTVVDSKKSPLPKDVQVFSGDLIKAVASLYPYENTEKVKEGKKVVTVTVRGIALQLQVVQLIDKRNNGSNGTDLLDEEDGFVADGGDEDDEDGDTNDAADGDF